MKCPTCHGHDIICYDSHYDFVKNSHGGLFATFGLLGRILRQTIESRPPDDELEAGYHPAKCNKCGQVMMRCPECDSAIPLSSHPANLEATVCPGCKKHVHYGIYEEIGGG